MVQYVFPVVLILFAAYISLRLKKLTPAGGFAAGITALLIYAGGGYAGLCMLAAFFVMATLATGWKRGLKQKLDPAEADHNGRKAGQVLANGGIAAVAGFLSFVYPVYSNVFLLMMAASLSAATSDTLASELGMIYGRRFYNIVTLKKDLPGLNGVVSIEGIVAGISGSCIIAFIYAVSYGFHTRTFIAVVVAGTAGNLANSLLGATLERKKIVNNDAVNALNTLIAALLILALL